MVLPNVEIQYFCALKSLGRPNFECGIKKTLKGTAFDTNTKMGYRRAVYFYKGSTKLLFFSWTSSAPNIFSILFHILFHVPITIFFLYFPSEPTIVSKK